jgi:hypothetical protein
LEEEDRRYLEALRDRNHVATKTTRHPLGLFSVVMFILQQVLGWCLLLLVLVAVSILIVLKALVSFGRHGQSCMQQAA